MKLEPITPEQMENLYTKVRDLITNEVGLDEEGCARVGLNLTNLEQAKKLYFSPVPHEHKAKTPEDFHNIERALSLNLTLAYKDVDMFFQTRNIDHYFKMSNEAILAETGKLLQFLDNISIKELMAHLVKNKIGDYQRLSPYDLVNKLRNSEKFNISRSKNSRETGDYLIRMI